MIHIERVKKDAAKYNWYLSERYGMIRSLLVPDFKVSDMVPVFGMLVFTFLLQATLCNKLWSSHPYQAVVLASIYGVYIQRGKN